MQSRYNKRVAEIKKLLRDNNIDFKYKSSANNDIEDDTASLTDGSDIHLQIDSRNGDCIAVNRCYNLNTPKFYMRSWDINDNSEILSAIAQARLATT